MKREIPPELRRDYVSKGYFFVTDAEMSSVATNSETGETKLKITKSVSPAPAVGQFVHLNVPVNNPEVLEMAGIKVSDGETAYDACDAEILSVRQTERAGVYEMEVKASSS